MWGDWSDYGDCSAACGADYKQRTRSLTVKSGDAPDTSTLFNCSYFVINVNAMHLCFRSVDKHGVNALKLDLPNNLNEKRERMI